MEFKLINQIIYERKLEWVQKTRDYDAFCKPVYALKDDELIHLGSAVFTKYKTRKFLITAAHVLEECKNSSSTFCIIANNQIIEILGGLYHGTLSEDPLDFAWLEVNIKEGILYQEKFIELFSYNQLGGDNRLYMALGYPNSKNKVSIATKLANPKLISYSSSARHEEDFIFVDYEKENCIRNGAKVNSPDLKGMSGGPLFDLGDLGNIKNHIQQPAPRLAGIIIEHNLHSKTIRCTKINTIFSDIDRVLNL